MNAIIPLASLNLKSLIAAIPAFSPVQESIPQIPNIIQLSEKLTVSENETGLIVWRFQNPVAWISAGYHEGQSDRQPKRCDFVDVVYHRQTTHGINLETADFFTLPEALEFIADVFGGES